MIMRIICLVLAILILAGCLIACGSGKNSEPTKDIPKNIIQKSDPAEDDTLNILMIGSSFCYYYVEELYGMLTAAGIKAKVCNVYYSGCPLEKHWTWWKSGDANYEYYEMDENGRRKGGNNGLVNLDYCLAQANWDIISLQESTGKIFKIGAEAHLPASETYWKELIDYLMEQYPMSRHLWHQTWSNQVEYGEEGKPMTPELQESQQTEMENFAKGVCDYYKGELERVPSGRAWQICRRKYGYDYLTCRLKSRNGEGDGTHDGDIGGGQYLNACVWYEVITGKSCVGNSFVPTYSGAVILSDELQSKLKVDVDGANFTLKQELIDILQKSAHEAVASTGLTVSE